MVPKSNTSDYPFTGENRPDRTGSMLVLEASSLALEGMVDTLESTLDLTLNPDHADETELPLEYTLDIGFDTDVEETVHPRDLPPSSLFRAHLLHTNHYGNRINYQPVMAGTGSPVTLATGSFTITVTDADEGDTTTYGRDRSPALPDDDTADYAARAFGPDHEVRLSDIDWSLDDDAIGAVKQYT